MKKEVVLKILIFDSIIALALLFAQCKQIEYITVEKTKNVERIDTFIQKTFEYDSIFIQDSVYREKYDSLWREYQLRKEIHYKILRDTTREKEEIHDTTMVEIPVEIPVEKDLSFKDKLYLWIGKYCWWIVLIAIILFVFNVYRFIMGRR